MIKDYKYCKIHSRDGEVLDYIKKNRIENKNYKVIDIGTALNSWSDPEVDATVDILDLNNNKIHFKGNINYFEVWQNILNYVDKNGKFDFSICSHVLEDISNPGLVSHMISKISKSGFIAFPSKYVECARHGTNFRGWIHHRWIFNYENGKVIGYPKLPFTEYLNYLNMEVKEMSDEFSFFWEDSCNIEIINNDFFPSGEYMTEIYKNLID